MALDNVIQGIVDQIALTNGFEAGNSGTAVAYDHRVLATGVDRVAVVLPDQGEQRRMVMGKNEMTHNVDVQLFIRHNNDIVAARRDGATYLQNIIQRINDNPALGGSAFDSIVTTYRVEDEDFVIGGVHFILESLTVRCEEHLSA